MHSTSLLFQMKQEKNICTNEFKCHKVAYLISEPEIVQIIKYTFRI